MVNQQLNAVVVPLFDRARADADAADAQRSRGESLGPLHGIPVTVKENFDVARTPTTAGIVSRRSHAAVADAAAVRRLREAGAILLGKTNLAQLMLFVESDNPLFGRTNNPWDLRRSPGGSSGGEGAIIASGGSVIGLGNDIGGSIRNPAHCCGIQGILPTPGRIPYTGAFDPNNREGGIVSQAGPLARSVGDLTLALDVLTGGGIDPHAVEIRGLRVGFYIDNGVFSASPALRRAVREAAQAMAELGVEVEEFAVPRPTAAFQTYMACMSLDGAARQKEALQGSKRDARVNMLIGLANVPNGLRPMIAALAKTFGQCRTADAVRTVRRRLSGEIQQLSEWRRSYRAEFLGLLDHRRLDALICPPFALPAVTHGATANLLDALSHTSLYNLLGFPAGVVAATRVRADEESDRPKCADLQDSTARKVERGSAGLPVGVQVVARDGRDDIVLALMALLEREFRQHGDYPTRPPV